MQKNYTRRQMLRMTFGATSGAAIAPHLCFSAEKRKPHGTVLGDAFGAPIGETMLAEGGNAIDAAVCAAFAAMISSPSKCGPGGYGGAAIIALGGGKKITCIDFNSAAPTAARPEMFPLDDKGNVKGRVHSHGWLAAGVPGTTAGLQLALERYGTKSLREVLQPAINLAKEKPRQNEHFNFNALIQLLSTLAERNSVESMYRGDIAQEIADAFRKNGGLVTTKDLAAYHARELAPYQIQWKGFSILTAPLCAGGLSTLQGLQLLKTLGWDRLPQNVKAAHTKLEALRLVWKDRLDLLGDPEFVQVPIQKLLSEEHARECAEKIRAAVKAQTPLPLNIERAEATGTMNISAVDTHGNVAAFTLTHGGSYGAKVTVENLGMVLGHGMSRFDPRPGKANSVAPGKRPLHNMSPTVILKNEKSVVAIGAAGGTKIPCAIYDFCSYYVGLGQSFERAIDGPRLNTVGTTDLRIEKQWPRDEVNFFKKIGYKVVDYPGALTSAVSFDLRTGAINGRNHFGNPFQEKEGMSE